MKTKVKELILILLSCNQDASVEVHGDRDSATGEFTVVQSENKIELNQDWA